MKAPRRVVLPGTTLLAFELGSWSGAAPARAFGIDTAAIVSAISALQTAAEKAVSSATDNLMSSISNMGTSLFNQLSSGFTQLTNYTKASVGASEQIADANNLVASRLARDVRNAQVRDDHTVNTEDCQNLSGGQSAVVAVHQARDVATALNAAKDARGSAEKGTPSWGGAGQAGEAANQLHFTKYCSSAEQDAGICTSSASAAVDADQKVSSLLGKPVYNDQTDINAANDYATNLIQPVAPAALRGDALRSGVGLAQLPERRAYNAAVSLAHDIADDVLSWRAGVVQLTAAQKAEAQAEGVTVGTIGSAFQAMDLEVNRHYSGVAWQSDLQAMPVKSVQVQIALLLAQSNYLAWQTFQLQQKTALAEARLLADQATARLHPQSSMPVPTP